MPFTGPDDPNRADLACASLAALAGVHCLLAPWIALSAPVLAGDLTHLILALAAGFPSALFILQGWLIHRELRVFHWAVPGWIFLLLARLTPSAEILFTVLASSLLVVAHLLNRSLAYWNSR